MSLPLDDYVWLLPAAAVFLLVLYRSSGLPLSYELLGT